VEDTPPPPRLPNITNLIGQTDIVDGIRVLGCQTGPLPSDPLPTSHIVEMTLDANKQPWRATWSLVNTLKVYSSTSWAKPGQLASVPPITPATKVPCPSPSSRVGSCVQFVRSLSQTVFVQRQDSTDVFLKTNLDH